MKGGTEKQLHNEGIICLHKSHFHTVSQTTFEIPAHYYLIITFIILSITFQFSIQKRNENKKRGIMSYYSVKLFIDIHSTYNF